MALSAFFCTKNATYIGKTSCELRSRINGHRMAFYNILREIEHIESPNSLAIDDSNCLGAHIALRHGKLSKTDVDESFKFHIISQATPANLRTQEQRYIETLNTLNPNGLNMINSLFV